MMKDSTGIAHVRAITFDPKSPASLLILNYPQEAKDTPSPSPNPSSSSFDATTHQTDSGTGCNAEEVSALMQLIKARDGYLNGTDGCAESLPELSRRYRHILMTCIHHWDQRLRSDESSLPSQQGSNANGSQQILEEQETTNLELLKITSAVFHLSEIFLSEEVDFTNLFESQVDAAGPTSGLTGAGVGTVTAGTVRYLRFHLMVDPLEWIKDYLPEDMDIDFFLNQNQPEYFDSSEMVEEDPTSHTRRDATTPFWILLRKLVLRGCLKDAWFLLAHHSAFQRLEGYNAAAADPAAGQQGIHSYIDPTLLEDQEAFEFIRSILLSAPLPGGRDDTHDDGRLIEDFDDKEEEEWVHGISTKAHQLWDSTQTLSLEKRRRGGVQQIDPSHDLNIHAAMTSYKKWKAALSHQLKTNTSLRNVMKRIPMIKSCVFDILLGVNSALQEEDSWSERLCFELLYIRPNTRTEDIHVRALAYMKLCGIDFGGLGKGQLETMILSIMKGHAATAIEALMNLGGGSGAALPEIMVAFLCSLLIAQNKIDDESLSYDIESELLLSASTSILSSFAMQNRNDVGIRLSTELLLPHALPVKRRIWAHMAQVLERHLPGSDAEARHLISCCDNLVAKGCTRIKDASESICFGRYLHYRNEDEVNSAAYWLCRGIEVSSKLAFNSQEKHNTLVDVSDSICLRELVMLFSRTSHSILELTMRLHSEESDTATSFVRVVQAGKVMTNIVTSDDCYDYIRSDSSIRLLEFVTEIGLNVVSKEKNDVTANFIIKCLEDYNDEYGAVVTLASRDIFGYLLSIAHDILVADENVYISGNVKSSFDVYGIQVLMSIYTQYISTANATSPQQRPIIAKLRQDISLTEMQIALAGGLKRAFIFENNEFKKVDEGLDNKSMRNDEPNLAFLLGPSL